MEDPSIVFRLAFRLTCGLANGSVVREMVRLQLTSTVQNNTIPKTKHVGGPQESVLDSRKHSLCTTGSPQILAKQSLPRKERQGWHSPQLEELDALHRRLFVRGTKRMDGTCGKRTQYQISVNPHLQGSFSALRSGK